MDKLTLDRIISLYNDNFSIRRIALAVKFSRSYIHLILKANIPNYKGDRRRYFFGDVVRRKLTPEEKAECMKNRIRTIKEKRWLPVKGLTYYNPYDTSQYEEIAKLGINTRRKETKSI